MDHRGSGCAERGGDAEEEMERVIGGLGDGFIYKDEDICETKGEATLVGDRSLCGTSSVKSSNGTCWDNTTVN